MNKHVLALSTALSILAFTPAFAQQNNTQGVDCTLPANVNDPACVANTQQQNPTTQQQQQQQQDPAANDAATTTDPNAPKTQDQSQTDQTQSGQSTQAQSGTQMQPGELIVPADQLNNAQLMSASDYIGKTVYDQAGNNIGEVNDLIVSGDGNVEAVILGVGGFLGIGEKDVAVNTNAVQMVQDGDTTRLIVQATKETLESAPTYDRSNRRYADQVPGAGGGGTDQGGGVTTDQTGSTTAPATGDKVTIDCALPENANNEACVNQMQNQQNQQNQAQ